MVATENPLTSCQVLRTSQTINRLHMFVTGAALVALFYHRFTNLFRIVVTGDTGLIPYLIVFFCEAVLTFKWILRRPARWRPVKRAAYPENLPEDEKLPPVDVFICTADPSKEPSLGVMNTVISAMTLDYPADKLAVYLHDDGGSHVTLHAMREAWKFAKWWVPFCRKYKVNIGCPDAFLSAGNDPEQFVNSSEYVADKKEIEKRYEEFSESLEKNSVNAAGSVSRDHPPVIEVMNDDNSDVVNSNEMPFLVYVAREKRPAVPHHFKGGALNALLRVSSLISNAPYFLVLDCDHYCNDPTSARQAMCFYFDPKISPTLAWVQFPQRFHDASEHDIYGGRIYPVYREGLGWDGLVGPSIYGCNFYMAREAIYGTRKLQKDVDLNQMKKQFGPSNELIKSLYKNYKPNVSKDGKVADSLRKEIQLVATCTYDADTEWGREVGYAYFTIVEDSVTSYDLHCKGWTSVFIDPPKPCFLGSTTTNLSAMLVQQTRWSFGLTEVGLSKRCPLIPERMKYSIAHSMGYAALMFEAIVYCIPFYGLAIIPQICLLGGVSLYPKVSDPFFCVFSFIFLSSLLKHAQEIFSFGDSISAPLDELRVWMMKSACCYMYATLNTALVKLGLHQASFNVTNKSNDQEQARLYNENKYDFRVAPGLIAPCCVLYILNLVSLIIGVAMILRSGKGSEMFIQVFLPFFGVVTNYHFLEGMFLRTDVGRISPSVTASSAAISAIILWFGAILVH